MPFVTNEQLTPRESVLLENEKEEHRLAREHALDVQKLAIEAKKIEMKLKQEDATKARRHAEYSRELELAIREQEVKWGQLLRLPILFIKLPVLCLFSVAYIASIIVKKPIESREFWKFMY